MTEFHNPLPSDPMALNLLRRDKRKRLYALVMRGDEAEKMEGKDNADREATV